MNREELDALYSVNEIKERVVDVTDLENKSDRTLIYGYTCERDTWHVYLKDGVIYTVLYGYGPVNKVLMDVKCNQGFVPNKRLYPRRCDFEFCKLLKEKGCRLTFTTWEDRADETFYGELI
jgi:hypothetical protein